jgi:hypothetical protein
MISVFVREINYRERNDDYNESGVIILETVLVLNIYLCFRNPLCLYNEFGVIILETLLVLNIYLCFRNPVT